MPDTFMPRTAEDACDAVLWASAEDEPLEILGHGTKRGLGRPVQAAHVLDLSRLTGIELYEPEELVLTALAGTPLAEIESALAERNQELAFDPIDYGPLLGTAAAGKGTIGGVIAANLAGSKRLKHGAARDHMLGLEAVSGRGEIFKSGGRVVKNVTGYDLPRALTGSYGTLAVFTRITVKVQPRAETEASFLVEGLDEAGAVDAMTRAMGSAAEVAAAAHVPEDIAQGLRAAGHELAAASTVLRLEGFGPSVDYRFGILERLLAGAGRVRRIEAEASRGLWRDLRDVAPFAGLDTLVWRVSVPPAAGADFLARVRRTVGAQAYLDWSGGLVWLSIAGPDPRAAAVREAVAAVGGGHATLVRAPAPLRATLPVFEPQAAALAALSTRLKAQFDPSGILNPGRMGA